MGYRKELPTWSFLFGILLTRAGALRIQHTNVQHPEFQCLENFTPWRGRNRICNISKKVGEGENKVFFIGLHKTGTTSYIDLMKALNRSVHHTTRWMNDALNGGHKEIADFDAFIDGGWHYLSNLESYEFGSQSSFDPRYLHTCLPRASFVLNVRPLGSWLASKLHHWMSKGCDRKWVKNLSSTFRCTETCNDDITNLLAQWIAYREYYHRRVIEYATQNTDFANRLLVSNLEVDGPSQTFCNLKEFINGINSISLRLNATCSDTSKDTHRNEDPASELLKQCVTHALQALDVESSESVLTRLTPANKKGMQMVKAEIPDSKGIRLPDGQFE